MSLCVHIYICIYVCIQAKQFTIHQLQKRTGEISPISRGRLATFGNGTRRSQLGQCYQEKANRVLNSYGGGGICLLVLKFTSGMGQQIPWLNGPS